jgi:tripartite-type tricarboxylate transporter receptor subunit TctC
MMARHWHEPRRAGYHNRQRIAKGMTMVALASTRRQFNQARSTKRLIAAFVGLAALPLPVFAQSSEPYPDHPVKLLIPYAPGGATDIIARHLSPKLQELLGQPFVVDNRAGASGNIALDAAAKAQADGYTLLVGNVSTNAINESTFAGVLQTKPSRDLVGITKLVEIPHVLVAAVSFPPNTVAEAIAWAKRNPGKVNYASAGIGTYPHLDMLRFAKAAGIELTHIPYKGGAGQMLPALLSGEVQLSFINLSSTIESIKAGKLKALATTMPARLAELPSVPTMAEQGFPGIGTNAWQGLFAPAATPKPIVDKLYATVASVLSRPEMKELLAKQLMTVSISASPQAFTEEVRGETQSWAEVVRDNKVKID